MKRLLQINTVCNGSTGKIMGQIQRHANAEGFETVSLYGRRKGYSDLKCKKFGGFFSFWIHVIIATALDKQGFGSYFKTKKMVNYIREFNPDIIHLHNLHGYYIHLGVLFDYLNHEYKGKIIWTLHDCWAFTGHCPYYVMAECNKWKTECYKCPNLRLYPTSLGLDRSKKNYNYKKELFTNIKNLTIIVPSQWLEEQVKESYLQNHEIKKIPHGIDTCIFKPTKDKLTRIKYNIPQDKKIVLGVANIWEERKGLDIFIGLSEYLCEKYVIVLVGVSKKQKHKLKKYGIIGVLRTEKVEELVALYSDAEVFLNPSREETFSLVTLEALACGTPVIATNDSATKELVSGLGVVINDNSTRTICRSIYELSKKNIAKSEFENYISKFTIEKNISKIVEEYFENI